MSKVGTVQITVTVLGDGLNLQDQDTVANSTGFPPSTVNITTGQTTIAIPSGAIGVKVKPPTANATLFTVAATNTDAGFPLSRTTPSYIAFDMASPPTVFYMVTLGTINGIALEWV